MCQELAEIKMVEMLMNSSKESFLIVIIFANGWLPREITDNQSFTS